MKYIIVFFMGAFVCKFYIVPILKKGDLPECRRVEDDLLRLDSGFPNLGVGRCLVSVNPNFITSMSNYSEVYDTISNNHYYHRDYILPKLQNVCEIPKYVTLSEAEKIKKQYKINQ